jgi:prolyl-tRNA editing enzyme YbaK/EbsC (Cys-tRNA(Pro) deacylase)
MSADLLQSTVREHLTKHGLNFEVLPCDESLADTAAFCEHYGYTAEQSANTILVAAKNEPDKMCACVVLANTKLDVNKAVCKQLGAKRASFASAEQTREVSGMEIGGVTVFGLPESMPVYMDAAVLNQEKVIMGGGNRTSKVVLNPHELTKLPHVHVVENLAKPRS